MVLQVTAVKFKANYSKVFVHIKKTDQDKRNVSLAIDKIGGIKRPSFIWKFWGEKILLHVLGISSHHFKREKKQFGERKSSTLIFVYIPNNNPIILTYFCNFKY